MSKLFFDHLVIREEIDFELNSYTLDTEDREELLEVIDQTLIHHVLNVVLNHLPKAKHPEFVAKFHAAPNSDALIDYLKTHAHPEIESEIKKQAVKIKSEILSEIRKARSKKSPR